MVLVIIIAMAWIAILGPSLMKRRSRAAGEIGSISHFHEQLRVLEHSGPEPLVAPAYRLHSVDGDGAVGTVEVTGRSGSSGPPVLSVVGARELPRPALAFLGEDPAGRTDDGRTTDGRRMDDGPPARSRAAGADARYLVRKRRRDTLGGMVAVVVGTLLIGFVPGASPAWIVTAVSGVVLVAYVALLVHLRTLAVERERKLRYLHPPAVVGPLDRDGDQHRHSTGASPTAGGRYTHPSYQAVAH